MRVKIIDLDEKKREQLKLGKQGVENYTRSFSYNRIYILQRRESVLCHFLTLTIITIPAKATCLTNSIT